MVSLDVKNLEVKLILFIRKIKLCLCRKKINIVSTDLKPT